jgi:hypothetical protein
MVACGYANENHRFCRSSPGFKRALSNPTAENQRLTINFSVNVGLSWQLGMFHAGFACSDATDLAFVGVHIDDFQGKAKNARQNDCE